MHFFKIILSIFNLIHIIVSQSETFTHKLIVDDNNPDQFVLYWKIVKDEIIFEAKCKTTGYVAVGISPNGGMAGADIAIGWVDDKSGKGYLKDCHATSKSQPIVDEQQDWFLESSSQKDGYTIIKMRRKLQTCDNNDQDIIDGSTFVIFAWNRDDPDYNLNNWKYHGVNRKTKTALLLDFKEKSINDNQLPIDTIAFDVHPKVEVPQIDTYYHRETIKLPVFNQDMHLIKYEMLIPKENEDIVHHYDVIECDDDYADKISLNDNSMIDCSFTNRLFIAWSIGGQYSYSFPSVAGFPLIRANKTKYIGVSIHYDNYKIEKGRVDTSGIRFYVTPTFRKYDLGVMTLGNMGINGPLSFTVPPNVNSITFSSICYPECMNNFGSNGIYVFAGVMHTHLLGISVRTSLVRKDKIIKNLLYNPNYDFNYQYLFEIEPTKVEKDDILITECTYSSKNYENFTFIGPSTRDEMCYSILYYYPALNFKYCGSAVATSEINKFYKDLVLDSLLPKLELNETMSLMNQENISKILKTQIRGSKALADRYTKFFESRYLDEPKCGNSRKNASEFTPRIRYEPLNDLTIKPCIKSSSNQITSTIIGFYLVTIYLLII